MEYLRAKEWSDEKIDADKPYWVGFNVFAGVGPGKFGGLLQYFETARAAWGAEGSELSPILGGSLWEKFEEFRREFEPEEYYSSAKFQKFKPQSPNLEGKSGDVKDISVLTLIEEGYPVALGEIEDAPPVLYVRGDPAVLNKPQVAIVGTRKMTDYGARVARELAEGLAEEGFVITSGLAYGIDTVAHRAALRQEQGETVAVLGCGVDICYPVEHRKVYEDVCDKGAVVSEIPLGMRTNRGIFVARNRIISGLSLGVVVVEGAERSGTLITAGYAAEQGREVFAVPGPITSRYSKGPHKLLKEGAKVITGAEDILRELGKLGKVRKFRRERKSAKGGGKLREMRGLREGEKTVIGVFAEKAEGMDIDRLARETGLGSGELGGILTKLEVKGIVKQSRNGKYSMV